MKTTKFALLVCLTVLTTVTVPATGQAQSEPVCQQNDSCDVEPFDSMSTGYYGSSVATPNGFQIENLDSNNLSINAHGDLGNALFFECHTNVVELPNPPYEYVTFVFDGHPATVVFQAIDSNGNVVDEDTISNSGSSSGAETITLFPLGNDPIEEVWMYHRDQDCEEDCSEPDLGEIRACNRD